MSINYAELTLGANTAGLLKAKDDLAGVRNEGARTERGVTGSTEKMSSGFGKVGAAAGKMAFAATAAISALAGIGATIGTIREFESSMSQVGAITRATADDLESMREVAKQLGSTTEFSAAQAADGLKFLGMAGFNAAESIAAIPAVLDLATASAMDLASAADISSNVLSGFGLAASDAGQVADVLAAASSRANTNVSQLGGAMSTVAPIAAALGIDLQDTASAIGVMSDAGIQGERAGTALRGVLASLAGPTNEAKKALAGYQITAEQVNPATQDLADIFALLGQRGLSTADAMTIFGREAASGALVLVEGANRVETFADELRAAEGAASDMAGIMRDNLGGDAQSAMSAVQGLAIAIGEAGLTAVLRAALQVTTAFVRGLTEIVQIASSAASSVGDFVQNVLGFQSTQDIARMAIDNGTLAMGDQITQIQLLTRSTKEGSIISEEAARVRLAEAQSLIQVLDATRQLNLEAFNESSGLDQALLDVQRLTEEVENYRSVKARASEQGINLPGVVEEAASFNAELENADRLLAQAQGKVEAIKQVQRDLTFLAEDEVAKRAELVALSESLESGIVNVKNGQVFLNGALVEGVDLSERLGINVGGINFSNAISGAVQLANTLQISVVAAASLQNLQASIKSGGGRGQDPRKFMEGGSLAGNASSASAAMDRIQVSIDAAAAAAARATKTLGGTSKALGAAGKAAKDAAREAEKLADEIERLEFDADPVKKYTAEVAKLDKLISAGLSDGAYQKAVQNLNDELANGIPMVDDLAGAFGEFIGSGLRNFKEFGQSIIDTFKNMIVTMVTTAARNRILFSMGITGGGVSSAAAAATGGAPGGGILGNLGGSGGLLGGIGTGISNFIGTLGGGSGILGGLGSVGGAFLNGGLSGGIGAIGSALSGASVGLGGLGAAIGAIALPVAAVAAVFSFFKKKTKELDAGLRITVTGMDALVESFRTIQTKRFWGLSKKVRTSYTAAAAEVADPIEKIVGEIQGSILDAAAALNIGSGAFENFAHSLSISTKGLSEADAQAAISEALTGLGDAFAGMIPELAALQKSGEGASEALGRLSSRLSGVNGVFDLLGLQLYQVSLNGAAAASTFVDLFDTLDNFNAVTSSYYSNFYSEAERTAKATQLLTDSLFDLGIDALPATRAAFRSLVDEAKTLGDDDLLSSLLKLSPAFAEITAATDALAQSARALITEDFFATGFDYSRSIARGKNGLTYEPPRTSNAFGSAPSSPQDMAAELRGIRADLQALQSTMQITAANTGRAADAADDSLAVTLGGTL